MPITGADVRARRAADRTADEGPLGTFWGAEVLDTRTFPGSEVPTVIANPVFLADQPAPEPTLPTFTSASEDASRGLPADDITTSDGSSTFPWIPVGAAVVAAAACVLVVIRNRRRRINATE